MKWYSNRVIILTVLCLSFWESSALAQSESATYGETRTLLLKLDRSNYKNGALPRLFSSADSLSVNLEKALYDEDQKVSLNAQVIIRYVAEKNLLAAFEKWG